jgi:hypothetical protein
MVSFLLLTELQIKKLQQMQATQIRKMPPTMLTFTLAMLLFAMGAQAQTKKELRQEKREKARKEAEINFEKASKAIYDTTLALPAESIQFKNRTPVSVMSNINFILLRGEEGVLQIGPGFSHDRGLNNLGGVTLKGKITNLKITEKKNRITMSFNLTGAVGIVRVTLTIKGSNRATADVELLYHGHAFTLRGKVVDLDEARFFIGTEY